MRTLGRIAHIAVMLLSLAGMASPAAAADIRVLCVGAAQNAVRSLAADFGKESGHHVILTVGSPAAVTQKIKDGEVFDAVIASEPAMDGFDRDGTVNPESRVRLANAGMGLAVRAGAPVPDISTPEAFKQALLAAKSVVYDDPALPDRSGEAAEKILAKAEILDALKGKLRIVPDQAAGQELIAKGEVEMGLYDVGEIAGAKGLTLAGPVPPPLQTTTTYEGGLMSDGAVPEAARAFIQFLAGPDARAKWLAARLEPLADH
ncbi:MAG TPA: substrate-binding domain-containing protein [Xanthobacteraceae bacterium]|jgi:molybdate transport system substrate-binding protein